MSLCLGISLDRDFAAELRQRLDAHQLRTYFVDGPATALAVLDQWRFEAVLVDADQMPEANLPSLFGWLSRRGGAPIVLLSSDGAEARQIEALESGASRFVVKPASSRLVAATLQRLVEAPHPADRSAASVISLGTLCINPQRQQASVDGKELALTVSEFNLLFLLASQIGDYVSRERLATLLSSRNRRDGRSADMHVCRVRKKLLQAGLIALQLESAYGRGYRLQFSSLAASGAAAPALRAALG